MNWKEHKSNKMFYEYADRFWQAKYKEEVYFNIAEYSGMTDKNINTYEVDCQIDEDDSITGKTINIKTFSYLELDFKRIEKDMIKIVDKLLI